MGLLGLNLWQNKNGTSDRSCDCGSWEQHWINFSGQSWPPKCSVHGCQNNAKVGAHVYMVGLSKEEYIIPMCKSCNGKQDWFEIESYIKPVSANVSETCKKYLQPVLSLLDLR